MLDPLYRAGDRLELVHMPDDPSPIPVGTKGTVAMDSTHIGKGRWQTAMKWDNGRTLSIVSPEDKVRILPNDEDSSVAPNDI
ncbi:DUF4314 domain-containing protein [Phyllobacterium myrsinacearum]|uniref:DUF4314 domain-containing protein n=1 Tax=Phyllobacterium myrsinacearum TaxID=28101 RepID=A0A839ERT1_9HYPH|nr:DUF4314 domain-containing protein [Phyllobacterium myrsinacearum]MBA8881639.1 hypothetical protein [Phyllobacterium myrsinacearum]